MKIEDSLEKALETLKNVKYESYGFPMFFLDWNGTFNCWSCGFRNPANFSNPNIKEDTPLKACNKMIEFLIELKKQN